MAETLPVAYLNGRYLPLADASVSVLDRGFLYGDAVYEVIPVYNGRLFRAGAHLTRLRHSLDAIGIDDPFSVADWQAIFATLVTRNGGNDLSIYLQVSRGAASSRHHTFPAGIAPTVFAMCQTLVPLAESLAGGGVSAITRPDPRWARRDIKATSLLPNVMLRQEAALAGAEEVILYENDQVTEGSTSSVLVIRNDTVFAPPNGHALLPGTTRELVLELSAQAGLTVRQDAVGLAVLRDATEIWLCSATREVVPVTLLDGAPVGEGKPGPWWGRIHNLLQIAKRANGVDHVATP